MSIKISKLDLEKSKPEPEDLTVKENGEEESLPELETFTASDQFETVQVLFTLPKKNLETLKETANIFNKPYGQLIREALDEHLTKLNNLDYLPQLLADDSVDNIIVRLKALGITYLIPKALKKIHAFLKDKTTFTGLNKWKEFCSKLRISEDLEDLTSVVFINWKKE